MPKDCQTCHDLWSSAHFSHISRTLASRNASGSDRLGFPANYLFLAEKQRENISMNINDDKWNMNGCHVTQNTRISFLEVLRKIAHNGESPPNYWERVCADNQQLGRVASRISPQMSASNFTQKLLPTKTGLCCTTLAFFQVCHALLNLNQRFLCL